MSNQTPQYPQLPGEPRPADKAHWLIRHKLLTGLGVLFVVGLIFGGANGGSGSSDTSSTSSDSSFSSSDSGGTNAAASDTGITDSSTRKGTSTQKTPVKKA